MILSVQNISKSFADEIVLSGVTFGVNEQEKAALVGINGAGKTTLLRIIMGELAPDQGSVTFAKNTSVGYLAQYQETRDNRTVYEEVLEGKRDVVEMEAQIRSMEEEMQHISEEDAAPFLDQYHRLLEEYEARDGYAYVSEVTGVLKGLGFSEEDFGRHCAELSGGQKTRVSLARLLVGHPDMLLLDEPTNHLDIASIAWLETFLLNYRGAVLVVSHDRYFLDRFVTKVVEISHHRSCVYHGNYSDYAALAAKQREERIHAYINQQREIRHQQEVIDTLRSFNREKSVRRAESRQKQLDRVEVLEKPQDEKSRMKMHLVPKVQSGKDVLFVNAISKSFGDLPLFSDLSFEIRRGEHVALIGENGAGKTTILKVINQVLDADEGEIALGTNVVIGYYDQEQQDLHPEKTLFDELADEHPDLNQTQIRNILAAFLFTGDDVFLKVDDLSGGERGRLSLARLMLSEANFLILDEPTNHLDMVSREILESALNSYEGTVLFVSHDRYFINRTAGRILHLADGKLTNYLGNYDYFLEKSQEQVRFSSGSPGQEKETPLRSAQAYAGSDGASGRAQWLAAKEDQARERKRLHRIEQIEDETSELEARLADVEQAFLDPEVATDAGRLHELQEEQTRISDTLNALYEEWECLSEQA